MEHLLTTEEVAEYLRVDVVTIRRLINRRELSAYRIGGEYRFTESDLTNYLDRQRVPAGVGTRNEQDRLIESVSKVFQGKNPTIIEDAKFKLFEHFNDQTRRVLKFSQEEAQRFKHTYIGTEHLLLGLIDETAGIAIQVLQNLNAEPIKIRGAIEFIIGRNDRIVMAPTGLTPRAKKVIELAVDEARRLDHHYVGTEHLLLGFLREGEGIAAEVLDKLGVRLDRARLEIATILEQQQENKHVPPVPPEAASLLAEGAQKLICSLCSAHSPGYFHFCFNCGQTLEQK